MGPDEQVPRVLQRERRAQFVPALIPSPVWPGEASGGGGALLHPDPCLLSKAFLAVLLQSTPFSPQGGREVGRGQLAQSLGTLC